MSRQTAIRARCIDCSGGSRAEVRGCSFRSCPLYPYRITEQAGRGQKAKAIKDYCTACSNGSAHERSKCPAVKCPLHIYRNGRRQQAAEQPEKGAQEPLSDD